MIAKRFPELLSDINGLIDSRKRNEYSMAEIVTGALFMFLFKETSRNAYNNDRCDPVFEKNYYRQFKLRLPHPDTIEDLMRVLSPDLLEELKMGLVSGLIASKVLRKHRFMGKYYFVAVDATGTHSFDHQHCEHCLSKTSKNGVTNWFHYVLEAKLVTSTGLSISLASEFIENDPEREFEKQDCERKAFVRLAEKIKKNYPRLAICILGDGLYPNNTVFDICRQYDWKFIITLKEGNLKTFQTEVGLLYAQAITQQVYRKNKTHRMQMNLSYLNDIEYGAHQYSWVQCLETKTRLSDKSEENQRFVYITNITQDRANLITTVDGGRLRWKIENEAFNTQKNQGYELEHKYSRVSYTALQNYYHVLQIAHMINQWVEHSSEVIELMSENSKQTIRSLWKDLLVYMKSIPITQEQLQAFLTG